MIIFSLIIYDTTSIKLYLSEKYMELLSVEIHSPNIPPLQLLGPAFHENDPNPIWHTPGRS